MANAGDYYEIELKPSHIEWGEYRHTNTRDIRDNEGYIPIPRNKAIEYRILNSNGTNNGQGIYTQNSFREREIFKRLVIGIKLLMQRLEISFE